MLLRNLILVLTLLLSISCGGVSQGDEANRPNVVFILVDDMGYGDISYLDPKSKVTTQNLDAMAREGVVYTDAHTSSSVCSPSRYSVLTGRYNWRTVLKKGAVNGFAPALIPSDRMTLGNMFRSKGYTTGAVGKWHLGWGWNNVEAGEDNIDYSKPVTDSPIERGFDYFFGMCGSPNLPPYVYLENDMPVAVPDRLIENKSTPDKGWRIGPAQPDFTHVDMLPRVTQMGCDFITRSAEGDKPFFLYLPLPAPHTPLVPTEEFLGKSGIGLYGDYLLEVDAMVGKVMQTIADAGMDDNTIVIFSADNGCSTAADIDNLIAQGHYPNSIYRGAKADIYDGGHRVPCIVRWRGVVEPHEVNQTICLTDFYATFAKILGYDLADDEAEDSYDISSTLLSKQEAGDPIREATVHHSTTGHFAIRKGDWKLILVPHSGGWGGDPSPRDPASYAGLPPMQLYNMIEDPSEENNLYYDYPSIVEELTALMTKYVNDGRSTSGVPHKNDGAEYWEELTWM